MKNLSLILIVALLAGCTGSADDTWIVHTVDYDATEYYGIAMANGRLGILPGKEPFSVKEVMQNQVFAYDHSVGVNAVVKAPVPFKVSMCVDGIMDWKVSDWSQTIDMRRAEHRTCFIADEKVKVDYRIIAFRDNPDCLLMEINAKALKPCTIVFSNRSDSCLDGMRMAVRCIGRDEATLRAGETLKYTLLACIQTSSQEKTPEEVINGLDVADAIKRHRKAWEELWKGDIIIEGDTKAQEVVRMALFNLYSSCREGSGLSIPPMGLSARGYNGHIFWDAEMWMYPVLLLLNPGIADSMLQYRLDRLEGAWARAREFGYEGLMFPWESDIDGNESTPTWALTGPLEHHISADVAIAAWNRYLVTKDTKRLRECWPVLRGVAEFLMSRVTENPDGSYSILDVVGADEYAEHVNDNAYTNGSAKVALRAAVEAAGVLGENAPSRLADIADGLRILEKDGVTMDYEGYDGRLTKQADPNLLAYPLGLVIDPERIRNDLEYYSSRIDMKDGPAMTWGIFAVQYARLGDTEKAYEYFRRSYESNLRPPFGALAETPVSGNPYFVTGAGALLQAVIYGFGGLEIGPEGIHRHGIPMPKKWRELTITTAKEIIVVNGSY